MKKESIRTVPIDSGRTNLTFRHDSRYVGRKAIVKSHSLLDIGFLTEERGILEPLDKERFYRPEQRFIAVATNCLTGETTYFEKGKCSNIVDAVRASATMPYISPMVMIDGIPYLDGGCSCKIPYRWAVEQGYEKIVLIKTREKGYRKRGKRSKLALKHYRKYPEFAKKLAASDADYNRQCDEIERLYSEGRIYRCAPSKPVTVGRVERDMEKLGELYFLGYNDCLEQLESLKGYLR